MLRGLNDGDQLSKGAAQGFMDGTRPQLHAQVLIHAVLQASEKFVRILMLPELRKQQRRLYFSSRNKGARTDAQLVCFKPPAAASHKRNQGPSPNVDWLPIVVFEGTPEAARLKPRLHAMRQMRKHDLHHSQQSKVGAGAMDGEGTQAPPVLATITQHPGLTPPRNLLTPCI